MDGELTSAGVAACAFAALLLGALGVAATSAFLTHGPEVFLARTIVGLAGCF